MRRFKDAVTRDGNPVGSRLHSELDPVTTERPCLSWTRDRIPSAQGATIYGCDQTPALCTVASFSRRTSPATPTAKAASPSRSHLGRRSGGLGGEAELLRRPERSPRRGAPRVAGLLRVRKHPAG